MFSSLATAIMLVSALCEVQALLRIPKIRKSSVAEAVKILG
jgi:hypothetical protein